MNSTKLTAKETALLTAIADSYFSFFDGGLVAGMDSGIWAECMNSEIVSATKYDVSNTQRGAASVMNSLARKGFLEVSVNEDGAWVMLTDSSVAWIEEHNGETHDEVIARIFAEREEAAAAAEAAPVQEELPIVEVAEEAAPVKPAVGGRVLTELGMGTTTHLSRRRIVILLDKSGESINIQTGTPGFDRLVFSPEEVEAAPAKPAKKARKSSKKAAAEEAAPVAAKTVAIEIPGDEGFTVEQWDENTASHGIEEYIQTKFADGSWTLRRRRNVSGAWRTDFWGQAAGSDKRVFTTSGAAKAARAAGKFTA